MCPCILFGFPFEVPGVGVCEDDPFCSFMNCKLTHIAILYTFHILQSRLLHLSFVLRPSSLVLCRAPPPGASFKHFRSHIVAA